MLATINRSEKRHRGAIGYGDSKIELIYCPWRLSGLEPLEIELQITTEGTYMSSFMGIVFQGKPVETEDLEVQCRLVRIVKVQDLQW